MADAPTLTLNAYELARLADCGSPDTPESPGAALLLSVQDDVNDLDARPDDDDTHQIADGAPDVYTYKRWQEFVDLAAWQEDLDELGGTPEDLTEAAGVALYIIARRLADRLIAERFGEDDDA